MLWLVARTGGHSWHSVGRARDIKHLKCIDSLPNDESFISLRMPVRPELRNTVPWVQILAPPLPPFPAFLASSGTSKARYEIRDRGVLSLGPDTGRTKLFEAGRRGFLVLSCPVVDTLGPGSGPFGGLSCPLIILSPDPGHPGSE